MKAIQRCSYGNSCRYTALIQGWDFINTSKPSMLLLRSYEKDSGASPNQPASSRIFVLLGESFYYPCRKTPLRKTMGFSRSNLLMTFNSARIAISRTAFLFFHADSERISREIHADFSRNSARIPHPTIPNHTVQSRVYYIYYIYILKL